MSFYVKAGVNMYYLSDRLNEVRTQSVAGRNKIEDYLSDRLNEVRTQSVAGRNKIEDYLSDRLNEVRTQSVAGRNKIEDYLRKSSKSPFIGNRCVREHYRATSDKDLFFGCPGVGWVRRNICSERNILCRQIPG
jgi:hypothetical protein